MDQKTMRIGLIVPSSNTVMEVDFYRNTPENVTVHTARMYLVDTTPVGEGEMLDVHFPVALRDIASLHPNLVVFGCTSAGALRGNSYDQMLIKRIAQEASCTAVSVIATIRKRLLRLGVKNLLVLTPYIDELNEKIKTSIEEDGVNVAGIKGLGINYNHSIGMVEPREIIEFALSEAKKTKCDGIFLSCTNFRAMEAREEIQKNLGVPVITSNQAVFEEVLELLPTLSVKG